MTPGVLIALKRLALRRAATTGTMSDVAKGTTQRSIRIADDVWIPANELAERLGETVSDVVRESLAGYIELHTSPTWAEAMEIAERRGDDLLDIVRAALAEYIASDA